MLSGGLCRFKRTRRDSVSFGSRATDAPRRAPALSKPTSPMRPKKLFSEDARILAVEEMMAPEIARRKNCNQTFAADEIYTTRQFKGSKECPQMVYPPRQEVNRATSPYQQNPVNITDLFEKL